MTASVVPWSPYHGRTAIASSGRTSLTSAFSDVVLCLAGFPSHELPKIFAAPEDEGGNDACRDLVRLDAEQFAATFVDGVIRTYARPLNGGEVVAIDPDLWEIDDPLPRFATGVFNLELWADPDAPQTHRLFVDTDQFERWLAGLKPFGPLTNRQIDAITDPQVRAARAVAVRSVVDDSGPDHDRTLATSTNSTIMHPGTAPIMLKEREVTELVGLSRSTIHKRTKDGQFPEKVKFGESTRWKRTEVLAWIEEQAARRGS